MSAVAFTDPHAARIAAVGARAQRIAVLATTSSDAHSWNLVVLQLLLEEHGYVVYNLGPCTPLPELAACCRQLAPELVVLSTVNGHGLIELPAVLRELRGQRVVVGGKLLTTGQPSDAEVRELTALGADRVFTADNALDAFAAYLDGLRDEVSAHASPVLVAR